MILFLQPAKRQAGEIGQPSNGHFIVRHQRRRLRRPSLRHRRAAAELMAAQTLESDLDLAYRLQLEEVIASSLVLSSADSSPSSSHPPPPPIVPLNDESLSFPMLQSAELSAFEQEFRDRTLIEAETRRVMGDFNRRIHDQKVAREILIIPEDEWGDNFKKPYGEGGSSSSDIVFRMYFKGLVSEERVKGEKSVLSGIGVAICDPRDNLIFEVRKPLFGNERSRHGAEARALIEGLNAALALDLKRITFFCDYYPLYQFVCTASIFHCRKLRSHDFRLLCGLSGCFNFDVVPFIDPREHHMLKKLCRDCWHCYLL